MNYCSDVSDDDRQTDRQTDLVGLISNEFLLQLSGTKREPTYTRAHMQQHKN